MGSLPSPSGRVPRLLAAIQTHCVHDARAGVLVAATAQEWSRFTPTAANRVVNPDTGTAPGSQTRVVPAATAGILSFSGLLTPGPTAVTNIGLGAGGRLPVFLIVCIPSLFFICYVCVHKISQNVHTTPLVP